jgi:hypothetical protein
VDGELPASVQAAIVDAILHHTGHVGTVTVAGRTLTWSGQTPLALITVTVVARPGRTTVRVDRRIVGDATLLFTGVGLGGARSPAAPERWCSAARS